MSVLFRWYFSRMLRLNSALWLALTVVTTAVQIDSMKVEGVTPALNLSLVNAVRIFPIASALASLLAFLLAIRERELILVGAQGVGPKTPFLASLLAILLLSLGVLTVETMSADLQQKTSWFSKREKRAAKSSVVLAVSGEHVIAARIGNKRSLTLHQIEGRVVDPSYQKLGAYSASQIAFGEAGMPEAEGLETHRDESLAASWKELRPSSVRQALGQVEGMPLISAFWRSIENPNERSRIALYAAIWRLLMPVVALLLALTLCRQVASDQMLKRTLAVLFALLILIGGERWLIQRALQASLSPELVLFTLMALASALYFGLGRVNR